MSQNDNLLRGEPHSVEAERTTLGTLLLDPERIIDVAPTVQPDDFYDPVYRTIYHLGNYDPHIVPEAYSTKGLWK